MDAVLLGFIDQSISDTSAVSWDTNKIGGSPCWMTEPSNSLLKCNVCSSMKTFVGQFYCPINESAFHRMLYVFVCCYCHQLSRKGSWTVLRSQCITDETSLKSVETGVCRNTSNPDEWCSDADDWDVDDSNAYCVSDGQKSVGSSTCSEQIVSAAANVGCNDASVSASLPLQEAVAVISSKHCDVSSDEPVQLLMNLTIDKDSQKSTKTCTNVQHHSVSDGKVELPNKSYESTSTVAAELEQYYVYVMEECSTDNHSDHVEDLLTRYSLQEGSNFKDDLEYQNRTSRGGEKYEKGNVRHGDYIFHKFTRRIANNPNQIVRYCRSGEPLFAGADTCNAVVPRCKCGSGRSFELQLMPALVYVLRRPQQSEPVVEFITVLIYTCSQNCWSQDDKCVEEFAMVEYDHDSTVIEQALSHLAVGHSRRETLSNSA